MLQPGTNLSYVCVGDEWHRFPSSFHLPHPSYRLAFVKSDFHGLLPRPFETAQACSSHMLVTGMLPLLSRHHNMLAGVKRVPSRALDTGELSLTHGTNEWSQPPQPCVSAATGSAFFIFWECVQAESLQQLRHLHA